MRLPILNDRHDSAWRVATRVCGTGLGHNSRLTVVILGRGPASRSRKTRDIAPAFEPSRKQSGLFAQGCPMLKFCAPWRARNIPFQYTFAVFSSPPANQKYRKGLLALHGHAQACPRVYRFAVHPGGLEPPTSPV